MEKQLCTYALMQILRKETDEDHTIIASEIIRILEEKHDMKICRKTIQTSGKRQCTA